MGSEPIDVAKHFPVVASHLRRQDLEAFAALLVERRVSAGDVVLQEGSPNSQLFLIQEGELEVDVSLAAAGEVRHLGVLHPGEMFADVSFLDAGPASATIRAGTPSTLFCLERSTFDDLLKGQPGVAYGLLHGVCSTVADRLRRATVLFEDATRDSSEAREPARSEGAVAWLRELFGLGKGGS